MAAKGVTVATTDFPLYCIRLIGDRHILVAGGGGASKTGIPNAIVSFGFQYATRHTIHNIPYRHLKYTGHRCNNNNNNELL